jgi:hypothetical protein
MAHDVRICTHEMPTNLESEFGKAAIAGETMNFGAFVDNALQPLQIGACFAN